MGIWEFRSLHRHRSCLHRLKALRQPAIEVMAFDAGQQLASVRPLGGVAHMNPVGVALRITPLPSVPLRKNEGKMLLESLKSLKRTLFIRFIRKIRVLLV